MERETFTKKDLEQLLGHGLTAEEAHGQLDRFRAGFPFLRIDRAATVGEGIVRFDRGTEERYIRLYDGARSSKRIVKFVPASGAATRMFKDLFAFASGSGPNERAKKVAADIDRFAFAGELRRLIGNETDPRKIVSAIIGEPGLGYGSLPKALILFHAYPDGSRTALEEHLAEGAAYAAGSGNTVNIHFTVSPEHLVLFEKLASRVRPFYEKKFGVRYSIDYSLQQASTDTIAVTPDNEPFRKADGSLLLRPSGHGALLGNLNRIDADLIFIKNIDNVTTDSLRDDTVRYKKILGGLLLELQRQSFDLLETLERTTDTETIGRAARFIEQRLSYGLPGNFHGLPSGEQAELLRRILDRPIRVCGMVKNEGEPGGGPFWTLAPDGSRSLQIAESSQIAPGQKELMRNATHFNPVDLVCGTRNRHGETFPLDRFVDPETGFISEKSFEGRGLKALERPGLWNGAMAHWNTVFAEVPVTTFSPVKTVDDLLAAPHRNDR